jgi:hypothetical protein
VEQSSEFGRPNGGKWQNNGFWREDDRFFWAVKKWCPTDLFISVILPKHFLITRASSITVQPGLCPTSLRLFEN